MMVGLDSVEQIKERLIEHEGRITRLEIRTDKLEEAMEIMTKLRIELGQLQTQIKITWALMLLVLSGLVGVAFTLLTQ